MAQVRDAGGALVHPILSHLALQQLSRDRTGEAERKPWREGLRSNRMIHWLSKEKGRCRVMRRGGKNTHK